MSDLRVEQLERSVRELATALAEVARTRRMSERMTAIMDRHPPLREPPAGPPDEDPGTHTLP